jgi:hypothetical protein
MPGSHRMHRKRPQRGRVVACAFVALSALSVAMPTEAQAQGFLDFLFGTPPRPQQPAPQMLPPGQSPAVTPRANQFSAGPPGSSQSATVTGTGRVHTYCVRLCDGRYFPLERQANITPANLCSAFCPASATKTFTGAVIDQAVAPDGERYPALKNAYVYRKRLVADCTCNGRDVFGLATLTITDPTLRSGDVVEGMPRNEGTRPR